MRKAPPIQCIQPYLASRLHDTHELGDGGLRLGERLRYSEAEHAVEDAIPERQMLDISHHPGILAPVPRPRLDERNPRIVEAHQVQSKGRGESRVSPGAATRIKPPSPWGTRSPNTRKVAKSRPQAGLAPTGDTGIVLVRPRELVEPFAPAFLES